MEKKYYLFEDSAELAAQLAVDFKDAVSKKAASGGSLTVALSGGHTPKAFFEILAEAPYKEGLPWENVIFFWGDERCVPPDNDESNFKMTNIALLSHIDIPASNIHRVLGEYPPTNETLRYEKVIEENVAAGGNGFPSFDWIFLGMGDDGHTASLFPGASNLKEMKKICVVAEHPETGQKRVSLTFPVINNAKRVSFLVAGEAKAPVFKEILEKGANPLPYPASMVNPENGVLEWYLDKAAAPEL
ncbi:MAG: 6-phosphogluconolactonase [Thermodesulfobacteriales bacterium]|nr:MAG: 6-phosphogluconolactonase [Thermodesulfobacteriales bacterium]